VYEPTELSVEESKESNENKISEIETETNLPVLYIQTETIPNVNTPLLKKTIEKWVNNSKKFLFEIEPGTPNYNKRFKKILELVIKTEFGSLLNFLKNLLNFPETKTEVEEFLRFIKVQTTEEKIKETTVLGVKMALSCYKSHFLEVSNPIRNLPSMTEDSYNALRNMISDVKICPILQSDFSVPTLLR
jgi:hypothetical protein